MLDLEFQQFPNPEIIQFLKFGLGKNAPSSKCLDSSLREFPAPDLCCMGVVLDTEPHQSQLSSSEIIYHKQVLSLTLS